MSERPFLFIIHALSSRESVFWRGVGCEAFQCFGDL
jgi:hypothetical protein